jgi:predicted dehydrogenase
MSSTTAGRKVRFGLIGCGEIAVHSARALLAAGAECAVTAVQDVVEALAADMGRRCRAPYCTDAAQLLARDDVDAVVISTPHYLHAPLTVQAARAGKHVACEKPVACTLAQADAMIAACREAGVLLSILYCTRYDPALLKARELLKAGALGKIIRLRAQFFYEKPAHYWSCGYTRRARGDWRRSVRQAGGGVLLMNGSHTLDRIHWLTGLKPVRVYAESDTHATRAEVEDNIAIVARYANGAIGSIDAMSCARGRAPVKCRLFGTRGQIDFGHPLHIFTRRARLPGLKADEWNVMPLEKHGARRHGRAFFFAEFARAVLRRRKRGPIPGEEARRVLEFCLAAYESARTHAPVELSAR